MLLQLPWPVAFVLPLGFSSFACNPPPDALHQLGEHDPTARWLPSPDCLASESGVLVSIDESIMARMREAGLYSFAYWDDCTGEWHYFQRDGERAHFAHVPQGHVWYLTLPSYGGDLRDEELLILLDAARELGAPGINLFQTMAWTDAASTALARCNQLEALCLGWSVIYPPRETAELVAALSVAIGQLKSLRVLELQNFPAAEASAILAAAPESIEYLLLGRIQLDGEAVRAILGLPRLQWLGFDDSISVSDDGLAALLAKPSLRRFDERFSGLTSPQLRAALSASELKVLSLESDDLALDVLSMKPEWLNNLEGLALSVRELERPQVEALLAKTPRLKSLGFFDVRPTRDWLGTMASAELPDLQLCRIEGELDASSIEPLQSLLERDTIQRVVLRCKTFVEELRQLAGSPKGQKLVLTKR